VVIRSPVQPTANVHPTAQHSKSPSRTLSAPQPNAYRVYLLSAGFSSLTPSSLLASPGYRNVFEATLFLLVAHAFDVGDLLEIEGTHYRVTKITLLYTVS